MTATNTTTTHCSTCGLELSRAVWVVGSFGNRNHAYLSGCVQALKEALAKSQSQFDAYLKQSGGALQPDGSITLSSSEWAAWARRKGDEVTKQVAAESERLRAELERVTGEREQERVFDVRNLIPCTYGDFFMTYGVYPDCEGHEWDNRTSAENINWLIPNLLASIASLRIDVEASGNNWDALFQCFESIRNEFLSDAESGYATIEEQTDFVVGEIVDLKASLTSLQAEAAESRGKAVEWLPIESAPRDGRTLLLGYFNSTGKWRTLRGQWFSQTMIDEEWEDNGTTPDEGWYETSVEADDTPNCWPATPSHWQPLPANPKEVG